MICVSRRKHIHDTFLLNISEEIAFIHELLSHESMQSLKEDNETRKSLLGTDGVPSGKAAEIESTLLTLCNYFTKSFEAP